MELGYFSAAFMEALLLTNYLSDDEARSVLLRFQGDRLMNQNDRFFLPIISKKFFNPRDYYFQKRSSFGEWRRWRCESETAA